MKAVHLEPAALGRILRQHYLFSAFEPSEMAFLCEQARPLELATNDILFHQDDPADRFYLVVHGQIKLFRLSPAGQEKVVEIMGPGKTFAEAVTFMQQQRYPVTTQALEPSLVLGLPNGEYLRLLQNNIDSCFRLLGNLSQRLHLRLTEIDTLALQNAGFRVARYLSTQLPPDAGDSCEFQLTVPKQVIASRLSIQPETLSRVLQNLSSQGIATISGRSVRVHDVARLREFG